MTFTLTGTVKSPLGTAAAGTVTLTPTSPILDTAGNVMNVGPEVKTLAAGVFTYAGLPDSTVASGYVLEFALTGVTLPDVEFAAPAAGTTLDLTDIQVASGLVVPDPIGDLDAAVASLLDFGGESETSLDALYASPVRRPAPAVAKMVTNFGAGHGFTNNSGGSANLNDTSDYVLGSQAVSATTDGAGGAKTIKKTGMTAFSAAGQCFKLWLKVDSQTHLAGLQLYAGDTNLANFYKWEMKSSASQKWILDGEWQIVTLPWGEATTTGSPNRAAITDIQLRIVDDAAGTVTTHFNGVALTMNAPAFPNGVASITFDDTYASTFTQGKAKMDQYGFAGTAYVIQEYVGTSGRMSLQNLKDLERYSGWEIAGHSTTGAVHAARFTSLTPAQLDVEFRSIRGWLRDNGFRGDTIAFPGGEFNANVITATDTYFTAGRTVFQTSETLPPARLSKLKSGGYVTSATTTASLTALVDQAYANQQWLILTFHDLVSTIGQTTDYTIANFGTVVDYLATKGIPVRTVGQVIESCVEVT